MQSSKYSIARLRIKRIDNKLRGRLIKSTLSRSRLNKSTYELSVNFDNR